MVALPHMPFIRANTKSVFKQACDTYDLVYFGVVSQHSDEHQMVRGFTLSPSHVDRHYCVGTVAGRDVVLLERTDTISFPDKPSKAYSWLILQVDLSRSQPLHVVLNSFHYDAHVYATLFSKLSHLHKHDQHSLNEYDQAFLSHFAVYAPLQLSDRLSDVLQPQTANILGHHFHQFDYEILQDELIIYLPVVTPSASNIEHIFKAGIWLAEQIDPADAGPSVDGQNE